MRVLPFLIAVLTTLPVVVSAAPEPYGKRYRAVDGAPLATDTSEGLLYADASPAELSDMTARLVARMELEELERGPYAPELSETLGDLSRVLEARGLFAEAQQYRERALHLVRINDGLYSPTQGPLVRATLDSLRKREAFDELDARYEYFFRLYGAGKPPFNDVRWAATLEYLRWQREAYLRAIDRDPRRRLIDLYEEHQALLRVLREVSPVDPLKLRDATLSQLQTLYLLDDLQPPRELSLTVRGEQVRREDPRDFDLLRERLESLQRSLRGRGRSMIEDALAATPSSMPEVRAELNLALGDWLLWQGARASAMNVYRDLWSASQGTAQEARVAEWFRDPTPLPQLEAFVMPMQSMGPPLGVVLSVSESGRLTRLAPEEVTSASGDVEQLMRYIRAGRFRPAMRGGSFVGVEDQVISWRLVID